MNQAREHYFETLKKLEGIGLTDITDLQLAMLDDAFAKLAALTLSYPETGQQVNLLIATIIEKIISKVGLEEYQALEYIKTQLMAVKMANHLEASNN